MRLSSSPNDDGFHYPAHASGRHGVALVIVLAFIVLLTALVVAYFSRATTGRMLSNSSAGQTKAAMLAQSASDIVISGLKQEIVGGSAAPSPSPANFYVPLAAANAVPVRYPTPAPGSNPADPIPNLVRRSVAGDQNIPAPAVSSLASAVNSATAPAINGHTITPARWNSHYLIPSYTAVATPTGNASSIPPSTPDASTKFVAPDWVLFTRAGPAVQTGLGTGATAVNNSLSTNQNYVIGRYAYAIYDEGGLLDMNVAGHPTPSGTPTPTGTPPTPFTQTQVSQKSSLALAELTQLPIVKNPGSTDATADPAEYLSQTMVDNIVGWRNYASANLPAATFPSFTFNTGSAQNWFTNFAANNTTGFLKVYGGAAASTGPTDQAFLSRQQLLRLRSSIGFSPNVLQYMGTFSRSLEQPSYVPDPKRPKIVTKDLDTNPVPALTPSTTPPPASLADAYIGNNDQVNADDMVNPAFLSVRVQTAFSRVNGMMAVVGEPLVKTKFALSRLALVTYTSTAPATTGGNHIWDYFGLSRSNPSQPWVYNHGAAHIMILSEVAAANREPDFAELLKAAINVGSLGKAGPNLHDDQSNYQYAVDVSVDVQVLQIMANLIDQYDLDSYPTIIQVALTSGSGSVTRTVRGVEDLPYFYRYHGMAVVTKTPSPANTRSQAVTFYNVDASKPLQRGSQVVSLPFCQPGTLSNAGQGTLLLIPEVWNPHDATPTYNNTLPGPPRPTKFRITAATNDPVGVAPWSIYAQNNPVYGAYTSSKPYIPDPSVCPQPASAPMTEDSTGLIFSDNNGQLFREPTLLWQNGGPSALSADVGSLAGPYTDVNTNIAYFGMFVGQTPLNFSGTVPSNYIAADPNNPGTANLPQSTTYVFQPPSVWFEPDFGASGTGYPQITFRIEYPDPNDGHWVPYDEQYPDFHETGPVAWVINKNDSVTWPRSAWANPLRGSQGPPGLSGIGKQFDTNATLYDPRTARFGMGTSSQLNNYVNNTPFYEAGPQTNFATDDDPHNVAFGKSLFSIFESQRPTSGFGNQVLYSNPGMSSDNGRNVQMRWFSGTGYSASDPDNSGANEYDGVLFAQNNPAINNVQRHSGAATAQLFYEDPDGIARRAMGAYVDTVIDGTGSVVGQPLAKSNSYSVANGPGVGTPGAGNLSRPYILNRPFQSVAEMSYAFRGEPWKQIDFFTPESGDTTLLDVFCLNEPPVDGMVAGKVNLNTHQVPVLTAIMAGAYRDELKNVKLSSTPTYVVATSISGTEANLAASTLVGITTDTTHAWRGPLVNIGNLVGRYIANPGNTSGFTDFYSFAEGASGTQYTYAGFSAALDKTVYTGAGAAGVAATIIPQYTPKIQRWREAATRALADAGQTRVWNLMIDVVAQTGRYAPTAQTLNNFVVDGEQRYWVHVAIDRFTGEVIDKQVEVVSE